MEDLGVLVETAGARPGPASRREILDGYIGLVASHEDLIRVLSDDPSVRRCSASVAAAPLFERLIQLLSDTDKPDTTERTRVRAALGSIHAALLRAAPEDDRVVVRAAALAAACGALGLRTPAVLKREDRGASR